MIMERTPIHPGEILADELEVLGMSALSLAKVLHLPADFISQIISGKQGITADTALRLSRYLGTTAEFWLSLQKTYELRFAEQLSGEEIRLTINPLPVVTQE